MQNQRKGAMEIIQKEEYGITCLKIKGRMDMAVAIETEKAVDRILKGNNNRLLFDLGELEYLSSYGLRIILKAAKKIKMMDGKIILCFYSKLIRNFLIYAALAPISRSLIP
jgi:anti-anti-sigma factor